MQKKKENTKTNISTSLHSHRYVFVRAYPNFYVFSSIFMYIRVCIDVCKHICVISQKPLVEFFFSGTILKFIVVIMKKSCKGLPLIRINKNRQYFLNIKYIYKCILVYMKIYFDI